MAEMEDDVRAIARSLLDSFIEGGEVDPLNPAALVVVGLADGGCKRQPDVSDAQLATLPPVPAGELRAPEAFAIITDQGSRSACCHVSAERRGRSEVGTMNMSSAPRPRTLRHDPR